MCVCAVDRQHVYLFVLCASLQQGKQLVAHQLRPVDVCEAVPNQPLRVRINLVNTLYTVKKAEGEGSLPEPVTEHKVGRAERQEQQGATSLLCAHIQTHAHKLSSSH